MGSLFQADAPKVAQAKTPSQSGSKSSIKTKKYTPMIDKASIYGGIAKGTTAAANAYRGVDPTVNYTPINTGRVPSLVGSSTYDFIRGLDPTGMNGGGITAGYDNGTINLNTSPFRQQQVQGAIDASKAHAADIAQQRGQVAPGYSSFRQSALQRLEDARKGALSNLRDNMARRGVLGSSFGEDAIARQDIEYQREAERINTESFLKEIELNNQLSQQEYKAGLTAFETGLNELNFQSDIAAKLTGQADQFLSQAGALLGDLAKGDASNQTAMAISDADNRLKSQIAQIEAQLARASGVQRAELEGMRQKALSQYQLNQQKLQGLTSQEALRMQQSLGNAGIAANVNIANANYRNNANMAQYEQQANQDAGIGGLLGTGLSLAGSAFGWF